MWDKHKGASGKCVKITPSQYCEAQLNPQNSDGPPRPPFGPVPPPPPPQELCEEGYASMLCMWSPNATERKGGRCVPTHCEAITNKTLCNAKSGGFAVSCAWVPSSSASSEAPGVVSAGRDEAQSSGRCIVFNENCSALPTAAACNGIDACSWNATGPDHNGPKACGKEGAGPQPGFGGWEFNCSNAAWYGLEQGDQPLDKGLAGRGPGALTLGTLTHYYHTLVGGVSVWVRARPLADDSSRWAASLRKTKNG